MIIYFISDDLGYADKSLSEFLQVFKDEEVKLNLAAIPARCYQNKELMKVIDPFLETNLFEIICHGCNHLQYSRCNEFPEWRTIQSIKEEIVASDNTLDEIFGDYYYPIFRFPWHNCDKSFIQVFREDFKKLSPHDIPIHLDLRIRDFNGPRWKSLDELINEFTILKERFDKIGILIHHYLFNEKDLAFEILRKFIQYLKKEGVEFKKLSEL